MSDSIFLSSRSSPAFHISSPISLGPRPYRFPSSQSHSKWSTSTSSRPPMRPFSRSRSPTPVIAWLTSDPLCNTRILQAASTSLTSVLKCTGTVSAVLQLSTKTGSTSVYYHHDHVSPGDVSILTSHSLRPVAVCITTPTDTHIPLLTAAMATPVLLERKGDTITRYIPTSEPTDSLTKSQIFDERSFYERLIAWLKRVYLPTGFPHTTTPDYMSFTKYRTLQNLASAIMQVISTEALLFGLGLGKKVAAGAAATSWVLKDGASYVAKILYGGTFGAKFDDDPKSWRITADIVEDIGGAIEILTPLFPLSYFLPLASLACCLRGMSMMTGTATRHVVYRSLAASGMQNTGDIATKGESQGVTMKMLGLGLGIVISSRIGQRYWALLGAYGMLGGVHIVANWKSVQCVQFSFLNKQRADILISDHLAGRMLKDPYAVSREERVVLPPWKGYDNGVKLGANVDEAVPNGTALDESKRLFRREKFMIFTNSGKVKVLLREDAKGRDVLRAYYTVKKYVKDSERGLEDAYGFMRKRIGSFETEAMREGWDLKHMLLCDSAVRVQW